MGKNRLGLGAWKDQNGTTTGNTVAVVYDNPDDMFVKFALSTDGSATEHQEFGDVLFDYYGYHVYLVP